MTEPTPDAIVRYLDTAAAGDFAALAECFTEDAVVADDGHVYLGRAAIIGWRESVASAFAFTTTITDVEQAAEGGVTVSVRVEGNFPGGVVDLTQRFALRDGLIAELVIAP